MPILVIGRNSGESFAIGDDITVTVKDCKNGRCRVIINAPSDVAINRMELLEGKQNARVNSDNLHSLSRHQRRDVCAGKTADI